MKAYPRSCSFTPFAIRIAFTSNYSPETCQDRLLQVQVQPSLLKRFFGASRLKFSFSSINNDLCEFEAERRVGRTNVIAKGHLQKIEDGTTAVVGYADAQIYFYVFLAFLLLTLPIELIVMRIYTRILDSLYVSSAIVIAYLFITAANILFVRHQAKKLAHIIEGTLK